MGDAAAELLWKSVCSLRESWWCHRFFVQRDVVWTIQKRLIEEVAARDRPYRVCHNYTMEKGKRRTSPVALVGAHRVVLAVEIQYEPDHDRTNEFTPGKFDPSVVDWNDGVGKAVKRVHEFVAKGLAERAVSLFFDEGGHFAHRKPHPGSWWDTAGLFPILITEA